MSDRSGDAELADVEHRRCRDGAGFRENLIFGQDRGEICRQITEHQANSAVIADLPSLSADLHQENSEKIRLFSATITPKTTASNHLASVWHIGPLTDAKLGRLTIESFPSQASIQGPIKS